MAKVLFCGDLYIAPECDSAELISREVAALFSQSDLRILNLETVLTNHPDPSCKIVKTGPHLWSRPDQVISILKQLQIDIIGLANNHIMDYGSSGLFQTINHLESNDVCHMGAGKNLSVAEKPTLIELDEVELALLNVAEHEWSMADLKQPGANPLSIVDNARMISELKSKDRVVIVYVHGGTEFISHPSVRAVKQYRYYIDCGADAVVCAHSHCMSGYETYQKGIIYYGMGNFLFTMPCDLKKWYQGMVVELEIGRKGILGSNFTPVKQNIDTFQVTRVMGPELDLLVGEIEAVSTSIQDGTFALHWRDEIGNLKDDYLWHLSHLSGIRNRYARSALFRFGLHRIFQGAILSKELRNRIRCESHNDVLQELLKRDEKTKKRLIC